MLPLLEWLLLPSTTAYQTRVVPFPCFLDTIFSTIAHRIELIRRSENWLSRDGKKKCSWNVSIFETMANAVFFQPWPRMMIKIYETRSSLFFALWTRISPFGIFLLQFSHFYGTVLLSILLVRRSKNRWQFSFCAKENGSLFVTFCVIMHNFFFWKKAFRAFVTLACLPSRKRHLFLHQTDYYCFIANVWYYNINCMEIFSYDGEIICAMIVTLFSMYTLEQKPTFYPDNP